MFPPNLAKQRHRKHMRGKENVLFYFIFLLAFEKLGSLDCVKKLGSYINVQHLSLKELTLGKLGIRDLRTRRKFCGSLKLASSSSTPRMLKVRNGTQRLIAVRPM